MTDPNPHSSARRRTDGEIAATMPGATAVGGGLDTPIVQMRHDHDDHGAHLRQLQALTDGFTLPAGACRSWQALYAGTARLSEDLMEHIHLENNILFPRYEDAASHE